MLEKDVQSNIINIGSEFNIEATEEKYHCKINEERAIGVLSAALDEYKNRELGFFDGKEQVEEKYINFLIEQGESNEFIANATFLLTTVIFGSSSAMFFKRLSRDPEIYKKYRWIFIPSEVVKRRLMDPHEEREKEKAKSLQPYLPGLYETDYSADMEEVTFNEGWKQYLRPIGRQKASLPGWYRNCEILCENYGGSVFKFFEKHDNDARKIQKAIEIEIGAKSDKKEFLRLGPKLTPLFLQWIGAYNLYDLKHITDIGLPVDFQLCRIAVQTGIVEVGDDIYREDLAYKVFLPLVAKLCREHGWEPRFVSEALWVIGSEGCTPDQRAVAPYYTCPLKPFCYGILHKIKNDYWRFSNMEKTGKKFSPWGNQKRLL